MKRRAILFIAALALVGALVPALPTEAAPGQGETLQVPREFRTIQAAVDAAAPGDRITVDAGTYPEEVVIEKDVDVRGTGVGATVIKAPARLTRYGVHLPDGRAVTAVVRVGQHAHVRISGLTVSGPIPCSTEVRGINLIQSATLELSDAPDLVGALGPPGQDVAGKPMNLFGGLSKPPLGDLQPGCGDIENGDVAKSLGEQGIDQDRRTAAHVDQTVLRRDGGEVKHA